MPKHELKYDPPLELEIAEGYRRAYAPGAEPDPYALMLEARDVSLFETGTSPNGKIVSSDSCRDGLREASARRQLAQRLEADAMIDLADWIQAAHQQGISKAEIARVAMVSRTTVHQILGPDGE
jgi:hypothetical protein